MTVRCRYRHADGEVHATLVLETCDERPRPAWYRINGRHADRDLELPEYRQFLVGEARREFFPDPICEVTRQFVEALANGATTDEGALLSSHHNLMQLAEQ